MKGNQSDVTHQYCGSSLVPYLRQSRPLHKVPHTPLTTFLTLCSRSAPVLPLRIVECALSRWRGRLTRIGQAGSRHWRPDLLRVFHFQNLRSWGEDRTPKTRSAAGQLVGCGKHEYPLGRPGIGWVSVPVQFPTLEPLLSDNCGLYPCLV